MSRILCLWFPDWSLQRTLVARPEWRGAPLAVLVESRRGRRVLACTPEAAAGGVRPGMPVAEAVACWAGDDGPGLQWCEQDEEADAHGMAELAEACERFSPLVGWRTTGWQGAPGCLLLDVGGVGELFGGERSLVRRTLTLLAGLGYSAAAAVAGTVGAAWALVRFGAGVRLGDGAHLGDEGEVAPILPTGAEREGLRALPCEALRLEERPVKVLRSLGVERIEQLAALPREGLASRLGVDALRRWDQAIGALPETIVGHQPAPEFQVERLLESPLRSREAIAAGLAELTRELVAELTRRRRGVVRLLCRLDCADGSLLRHQIALYEPTAEAAHLLSLLDLHAERLRFPDAVERLSLRAEQVAPLVTRQGELFAGGRDAGSDGKLSSSQARELGQLVDRLRGRLGPDAARRPRVLDDVAPERRSGFDEQVTEATTPERVAAPVPSDAGPAERLPGPLRRPPLVLATPVELAMLAVADGPPARFAWQGEDVEVARHWGPERLETGWWRGRSLRRDYYRVELRSGERLWVFRRLDDGRWFLHGRWA